MCVCMCICVYNISKFKVIVVGSRGAGLFYPHPDRLPTISTDKNWKILS